jgi:hypothetical protein
MKDLFSRYVILDFSCFPVQYAGKRPMFSWEDYQHRQPTDEEIAAWCADYTRANVAIATGEVSGIVVVDVDNEEGKRNLEAGGELPLTVCAKTAHGWHYYFAHPGFKLSNKARFIEGVDLRGDGGYVIAPPSVHPSGAIYEWEVSPADCEPAPMPEWLLALLKPRPAPGSVDYTQPFSANETGAYWLDAALGKAVQGTRDETAFWLACQLRDAGLSYSEAEAVLRDFAARVPQGTEPYTEREALAKVRSAWSQPPRNPAMSQRPRATRQTFYPEERWHGESQAAIGAEEAPPPPSQHVVGEKLWVDTSEVYARVLAEVLQEPETLSEYPPLIMPFNLLHQFKGFAHYAWRGKLMYVLGGPGFGKTSFGETMAEALLRRGTDWVWYGPEWSPLEMGYRAVHRNGGMSLDNVAAYQVYRHDEARDVPAPKRQGLPMGRAVQSQSLGALDAMLQWPGQGYFIPKAALGLDDLLFRTRSAVDFARNRGRDPAVWFIDYLQIMRRLAAAGDAMWGERLASILKDFCIDMGLLGVIFLQPRKDDTDRVRAAGMNAVDFNNDNSWLLDQNSAQGLSDALCNFYVTLNPCYNESGKPMGKVKYNIVKNSLGVPGSVWGKADLARLRYLDSPTSTAGNTMDDL